MIHIGLCADEKFSLPFGVCLESIFDSNNGIPFIVHVITQGFSDETISLIRKTEAKYSRPDSVRIYNINEDIFSDYPLSDQFPESVYFRYLYAKILPESVERIIYIDCDTVVLSDLRNLWHTEMSESSLMAAVEDRNGDDIIIRNRIGRWSGLYYNSGVLLMNLKEWRNTDSFMQFAGFIKEHRDVCHYPDQDAINAAFPEQFVRLPFEYNYHMSFVAPFESFRLHLSKKEELEQSFNRIVILHYAAEIKPWYNDSRHPLLFIWHYFYKNSEWRDIKLKYRHSMVYRLFKKALHGYLYRNSKDKECINPCLKDQLKHYEQLYAVRNDG